MKKIVFFDIDNTIWTPDQYIPPSAKNAIRALRGNGHYAVLNSGRARGYILDHELLSLGFDGIVAACGCYLEWNGKIIRNDLIPQEVIEWTIAVLKENHLPQILEGPKSLYIDPEDFPTDPYYQSLKTRTGYEIPTIRDHTGPWEVNKLSVNQDGDGVEKCMDRLGQYYDLISHAGRFMELVPKGHSKATGMDDVCALLGIPVTETYAFGDSANDLAMLRHAGCGVVMGNGSCEAKEAADYITDTLENDGLAKALCHFGLI